jgi:hypothetical protein
MRFNERITFVSVTESKYNPETGEYIESDPMQTTMPCNLSRMGIERVNQLFGSIDKQILTARLQQPYNAKFDYVLINDQIYNVTKQSDYKKGVFFLEAVLNGGV